MTSLMSIAGGHRIPCSNHPDREATVIQYRHTYGTAMECVGAFCSQECAEGTTVVPSPVDSQEEIEAISAALKERFGFTDKQILYEPIHWDPVVKAFIDEFRTQWGRPTTSRNPDAHLGAEEKE